jgi:hypothetical protein
MFLGPPGSASRLVSHKYGSGCGSGSGSGSFPYPNKVLSRLKKIFLAKNLILIIKHIFTILKLFNLKFKNMKKIDFLHPKSH